jgi:hypothetical protein
MNTAASITSISIFGSGGALSAYAQNPLLLVFGFTLAVIVVLAPLVVQYATMRHIIKVCGKGSKEFEWYSKILRSRGKSPPD